MKRNKRKNNHSMILLLLLVVCISVGYAAIATKLQINGTAGVSKTTWDVHFDNVQITEGSVTTTEANKAKITQDDDGKDTVVEYKINLAKPGDFYEFTVDVVNEGSLDALLDEITMEGLTTDAAKVVDYTVDYVDAEDTAVQEGDVLASNDTNTVKVRVEYKTNIDADVLNAIPEDGFELNLKYALDYKQADAPATDTEEEGTH